MISLNAGFISADGELARSMYVSGRFVKHNLEFHLITCLECIYWLPIKREAFLHIKSMWKGG